MTAYLTVPRAAEAELVIKKSRFIGRIAPVSSPEDAAAFVASIKTKHWDASHNVWAYCLRGGENCPGRNTGQMRYSDDGEPQGTAGLPVLGVLTGQALVDCVVVVTRYFGVTLLGTGGLVRAYGQSASAAVEAAGAVTMAPCRVLRVRCEYAFYDSLCRLMEACGAVVLDTQFAENIEVTLRLRSESTENFSASLAEKSNGRVCPALLREEFAAA